ncbi:uncharacterized protein A1O9_02570 [Exophiala aquamarina CBS 119918]|uniref:Ribosomal protein S15 n=1 Tax=Exophiala aquamarina CBS 119918 TaxID=1182545 RepID=A0A072PM97_9EURO|nr:uncharacterized protein A1O9_02570 [Exophiala aquamarina CBS 119918]KEF61006.1 hypothetical protein A1O9_02570 [Exophiala aquamarina CBS 119918]
MPPLVGAAASNTLFNMMSLLHDLPATSRGKVFSKCSTCFFSATAALDAKRSKKHKIQRHIDPYRLAQARQRKSANLARQKVLLAERQATVGSPVRSRSAPFVDSLHSRAIPDSMRESYLNYFLKPEDMGKSLDYSRWLSEPVAPRVEIDPNAKETYAKELETHAVSHENASKALQAIAALDNSSSKDRLRVNIDRCIQEFGRHNTDSSLLPKLHSNLSTPSKPRPRVGPDTGSSEVQIAILTTKINILADNLHNQDKQNKRNLRLLVHKRQKLLKYLRREDRGGPRWQNVVEKLGISDAMWKGEISL